MLSKNTRDMWKKVVDAFVAQYVAYLEGGSVGGYTQPLSGTRTQIDNFVKAYRKSAKKARRLLQDITPPAWPKDLKKKQRNDDSISKITCSRRSDGKCVDWELEFKFKPKTQKFDFSEDP